MTAPMKATVSDIAKSCGLSTATVDRVLNNRPGASAANRQRVMEAAKQLGYLPVVDQVALPSRPAHLEFFLPIGSNAFMIDLAAHIEDYAARLPLVAVTANVSVADREAALEAGMDDCLAKPLERAALLRWLDHLGSRASRSRSA